MSARFRARPRRGSAMVEFALAFLMLWLILSGVFHYGYSIYIYSRLQTATAEAARYAARVDFDAAHSFVGQVQNMAVYGSPGGGVQPCVPGLASGHISVTWTSDASGYPQTITVAIVGYAVTTPLQSWTITGKPRVTTRFAGRFVS